MSFVGLWAEVVQHCMQVSHLHGIINLVFHTTTMTARSLHAQISICKRHQAITHIMVIFPKDGSPCAQVASELSRSEFQGCDRWIRVANHMWCLYSLMMLQLQ